MISVNRTSDSVKMLKLSSQSAKNYTCWVNNTNHILKAMNITVLNTLEYDSSYSIGCVETEDRNHQCTEYNTTVLTGERGCNRNTVTQVWYFGHKQIWLQLSRSEINWSVLAVQKMLCVVS